MKHQTLSFLAVLFASVSVLAAAFVPPKEFKDISKIPGVKIELRYATENNFMKKNVYGDFKTAYLHQIAFEKLQKAAANLAKAKPGYQLLVFDALRPRRVQRVLFSYVKGTDQQGYVADPDKGSVHNYGFAVDLTVVDPSGKELDMGTPYDDFTKLAEPRMESEFLKDGKLTRAQLDNRLLLRKAMEDAGFKVLSHEWWHFDAMSVDEAKAQKHQIVE